MLSHEMFRDSIGKLSLRKKLAVLTLAGVVLPLLALAYLQYRSLAELENKTKGAFRDNLREGLAIVQRQMKQRLQDVATKTLSPLGNTISLPEDARVIDKQLGDLKRSHHEINRIFLFRQMNVRKGNSRAYEYAEAFASLAESDFGPPETQLLSLFEKSRAAQSFLDAERKFLLAYHYCQDCPSPTQGGLYLFYPLPNSSGESQDDFAGVLLDQKFVSADLIGGTIAEAARNHDPNGPLALVVIITDDNQRVLYANGVAQNKYLFESNFDRPLSSWRAEIALRNTDLDALARSSYLHSAGAMLLVLLFLLAGIALTIRATDREARLAEAKSNFVANVSHELKTPLSLLSLFSEILELDRVKSEEKRIEYYRIMRYESRRLNKMIDNILDFSKIEAGRKTYNLAAGDISEVIENVLSSYRYQIESAGFDVQTDVQTGLPPVSIDRDAMAQAISNLVDNAIKYSREGKHLSIRTATVRSHLSVKISDRGVGIPRAEQEKIFEKFYRVGNGLVHDVKGSGLGLALVKHIVEAHRGTISVESDVTGGTCFTILLPFANGPVAAETGARGKING